MPNLHIRPRVNFRHCTHTAAASAPVICNAEAALVISTVAILLLRKSLLVSVLLFRGEPFAGNDARYF